MTSPQNAIRTQKLTILFGGLYAVFDLDLTIPQNSIFGLIGPNGAGKTTCFNMLTGIYRPTSGNIEFFGKDVVGLNPFEVTRLGLARTFQNVRLFKELTVIQNLQIACDQDPRIKQSSLVSRVLRTASVCELEESKYQRCLDLLKVFRLDGRAHELAKNLPYGDQRRLEIARAMATGARMICLDEPAAGLNSTETASLMDTIRFLRDHFRVTILLIEHDMRLVMGVCETIVVLDHGVKIAEGSPQQIQKNPNVIEAYLGKGASHAQ